MGLDLTPHIYCRNGIVEIVTTYFEYDGDYAWYSFWEEHGVFKTQYGDISGQKNKPSTIKRNDVSAIQYKSEPVRLVDIIGKSAKSVRQKFGEAGLVAVFTQK